MKKEMGILVLGALGTVTLLATGVVSADDIQTDGKVVSTTTSGPPLAVSSTDMVDNLNADQLDGLEGSDLYTQSEVDDLVLQLQGEIDTLKALTTVLMDSLDTVVGEYVSLNFVVFRDQRSVPILLEVHGDRLEGAANVFYSSPGCEGSILMRTKTEISGGYLEVQDAAYGVGIGNVLFRSDEAAAPQLTPVLSIWRKTHWRCDDLPDSTLNAVPGIQVVDLDDLFTPPYHIE